MLAVAVTDALAVLDNITIRKSTGSVLPVLKDIEPYISSVWATDNSSLYLLSTTNIRRYTPTTSSIEDIYDGLCLSNAVAKDKNTLIFSADDKVHILECATTPKIIQTFSSHKSAVNSLSLSNDASLLASTSANAVHVHNLVHGSHTVLRGLPLSGQSITTAAFSRHSRTRLLIAIGTQLVVFDTTRPSGPMKTVAVGNATTGDIVAVACSPFSKTLIAVATSSGSVALVDLEKEKSLFRTLNLKVPLTTLSFSPEGASIYAGTETGRILILDLRGLDKPPRSITISESGNRVESMSVQPKIKPSADSTVKTGAAAAKTPNTPSKTARVGTASASRREPTARKASTVSSPKPKVPPIPSKVFSPVRDPLGNSTSVSEISLKMDTLKPSRTMPKLMTTPERRRTISASSRSPGRPPTLPEHLVIPQPEIKKSPLSQAPLNRPRATSMTSRTRKVSVTKPSPAPSPTTTRTRHTVLSATPTSPAAEPPRRTRTTSTSSRTSKTESISTRSAASQASRRTRTISSTSRLSSDVESVVRPSKLSVRTTPPARSPSPDPQFLHSSASLMEEDLPISRTSTPSPILELPDMKQPRTPLPQKKSMAILGLDTPAVERWIQAGDQKNAKGKGRSVGFADEEEDHAPRKEMSMELQVSPQRRPTPVNLKTWAPSPLRNPTASPGTSSAHDFLKGIVGDVMFEYQKESKAQIMSLHLEMMSMRRGWRKELGDVMEQYVGDLKDLREENKRLREENERLRRGY